jgi:Rieske 2Fe-2S family protein
MKEIEGFDKTDYPLHGAALAEWEGFVFVNIAEKPVTFESVWAALRGRFARYGLAELAVGHRVVYDVKANWKLVFQNYSECLHCPSIHPKLASVLPYKSGANDLIEGPFLGGYMEIKDPNQSATMSGQACGRIVSGALPEDDRHRGYYYSLMPNMLLSLHPDYVNYYLLHPMGVERTLVESEWLFHPETLADPKNNIQDAIDFWDLTNRQDWDIVERSHLGIRSRRYVPGPYSPRESIPAAWDREYLRWMGRE